MIIQIKPKGFLGAGEVEAMLGNHCLAQASLKFTISGILRESCTPMPCQKLYLEESQGCFTLT